MHSLTKKLVSNASAQPFRDNTLNYFKNVLMEKLNVEGQWKVTISGKSYPSKYQNVTEENFILFLIRNSKVVRILLTGSWSVPFLYRYC